MRALVLTELGPAIREVPDPKPKPGEVLVRVRASALNHADLIVAGGGTHGFRGGVGSVLGSEWSGEVVALGENVDRFRVGDRVMGGGGGFAEFVAASAERVLPIPDHLNFEAAACFPVALRTMHNALVSVGELQVGQTVLIQGASSGVGILAMQIAKVMGAAAVVGSSTNAERRARLSEFGADLTVDSKDPGWVEAVLDFTGGRGVDLIIDQVSGPLVTPNMHATRVAGRIVNVGRLGGDRGEFDADLHALRRIVYVGVTFRTRTRDEVAAIDRAMISDLWPALEEGRLTMPVDSVFAFDDALQAMARMAANQHFGKIVLKHEKRAAS